MHILRWYQSKFSVVWTKVGCLSLWELKGAWTFNLSHSIKQHHARRLFMSHCFLKLLQVTTGTVRLHFSLDPWHPCPCKDAVVTTLTQWRSAAVPTATLLQPPWQPPWRWLLRWPWLLYSRVQWVLTGTTIHDVTPCSQFSNLFLSSSHAWSFLLLVVKRSLCMIATRKSPAMFISMNEWVEDTGVV